MILESEANFQLNKPNLAFKVIRKAETIAYEGNFIDENFIVKINLLKAKAKWALDDYSEAEKYAKNALTTIKDVNMPHIYTELEILYLLAKLDYQQDLRKKLVMMHSLSFRS